MLIASNETAEASRVSLLDASTRTGKLNSGDRVAPERRNHLAAFPALLC